MEELINSYAVKNNINCEEVWYKVYKELYARCYRESVRTRSINRAINIEEQLYIVASEILV